MTPLRKYYILTILPFLVVATALVSSEWFNMEQRIDDLVSQSLQADQEETLQLASNPIFISYFDNIFYGLEPEASLNLQRIAVLFDEKKEIGGRHLHPDYFVALLSEKEKVLVARGKQPVKESLVENLQLPNQLGQVRSHVKDDLNTTTVAIMQGGKPVGYILIQHKIPIEQVTNREFTILKRNLLIILSCLLILIGLVHLYLQYEKRDVKMKLREKDANYEAIVKGFPGLIYIAAANYTIKYMSKNLINRAGFDGTGQKCHKILHDLNGPCAKCCLGKVFKGEKIRQEVKSPKDERWYDVISNPIYHPDGSISKQTMLLDITGRKRAEDGLQKVLDELEQRVEERTNELTRSNKQLKNEIVQRGQAEKSLEKSKDELEQRIQERTFELQKTHEQLLHSAKLSAIGGLSASIAHEFNNPLQGVMTVISGVKRRAKLDEDDVKMVDMAISECNRMKDLTRSLQDFNRPSSGRDAPMNIHATIDSLLLLSKKEYQIKGVTIELHYADDMLQITAVADQIKQVLLNLLNNAAYACAGGGTIVISTKVISKDITIKIQDSGKGVKPEHMDKIFDPFFTTKPAVKGTGLGLSVSYGIIKKHGGRIEVASVPDMGTTFTITLPIKGVNNGK